MLDRAEHLSNKDRIQKGAFYTPPELVSLVHSLIKPYLEPKRKELVILDSSAGHGNFMEALIEYDYRIAENDPVAIKRLLERFDKGRVFSGNSLCSVSRRKYGIKQESFLIIIGNPPYNDTTSEYKNGRKGKNECDPDLFDRDIGISFMRSYSKLCADIVCILHPLSYLIKEANYKRLDSCAKQYRLTRSILFSSALFWNTGNARFPICCSLYERTLFGMTYEQVREFKFELFKEEGSFQVNKFVTTDGVIRKYPPRKREPVESPIGIYFYTFRDINSLTKNASFSMKRNNNSIVVSIGDFYKYAYLYAFKRTFKPKNRWLYGNLSPILNYRVLEGMKKELISYALNSKELEGIAVSVKKQILTYYGVSPAELRDSYEDSIKYAINEGREV